MNKFSIKVGEKLTDDEIVKRLNTRLSELLVEQSSCTANYFSSTISRCIRELEDIRGRPYITCTKCGQDLTLKICKHHNLKSIESEMKLSKELRSKKNE